jgi:hypothetical protein
LPGNRAGKKTVKKAKAKKAGRNPKQSFDDELMEFSRRNKQVYLDRFKEIIEEHGTDNVVVFTVDDAQLSALNLAAGLEGKSIHAYAKASTLSWAATDCDEHVVDVQQGRVKVGNR